LLEDAELRGAVDTGDNHAAFDALAPGFDGGIFGIDDLHGIHPSPCWRDPFCLSMILSENRYPLFRIML
jgi:hypothetical protein